MNILQSIRDRWPSTETKLLADPDTDYINAKLRAVQRAIQEVYSINAAIIPLPTLAQIEAGNYEVAQQVADVALLSLIPLAKDYYLQTYLSTSESYPGAGSGSVSRPNPIATLESMEEDILDFVEKRKSRIIVLIGVQTPQRRLPVFFTTLKAPVRLGQRVRSGGKRRIF